MAGGKFSNPLPPFPPHDPQKRRSIIEIAARREIEPFRQGQLDMFCGLYSCINALQLALHGQLTISKSYATELYREGMAYLDGKSAACETACEGMGAGRQRRLLAYLSQQVKRDEGVEVVSFNIAAFWKRVHRKHGNGGYAPYNIE